MKINKNFFAGELFSLLLMFSFNILAQVPRTISYQGVLTDAANNPKPDGNYMITFSFYESGAGGEAIWSESKSVKINKGLFSTSLGYQTPFSSSVKFDKPYWLGVKVEDEAELTPRIALTSSGYSISSNTAFDVADGKVVKSLNNLKDNVTIEGSGGTTVNTNGSTITISSSGEGGTGIQGVQNTNNTIDITNPNGPTATINLKVPLTLNSSESNSNVKSYNSAENGGVGIWGESPSGAGLIGKSSSWVGTYGESDTWRGVWGKATGTDAIGVYGEGGPDGTGVHGINTGSGAYGQLGYWVYGVYGKASYNNNWLSLAGAFDGDVIVSGELAANELSVSGDKHFKIDDPLDPANKFLIHSCIESSERMNIYSGNITTDASGSAIVQLPVYFEALNIDYRYQLAVIGQFAQAIIERKIQNNRFTIKTDKPNVEVSWQVTGVRNDPHAKTNPFIVEQEKEKKDKGKYLRPELFGQPEEKGIHFMKKPEITMKEDSPVSDSSVKEMPNLKEMKNNMQNEINRRKENENK
jgi:hypothetical protein